MLPCDTSGSSCASWCQTHRTCYRKSRRTWHSSECSAGRNPCTPRMRRRQSDSHWPCRSRFDTKTGRYHFDFHLRVIYLFPFLFARIIALYIKLHCLVATDATSLIGFHFVRASSFASSFRFNFSKVHPLNLIRLAFLSPPRLCLDLSLFSILLPLSLIIALSFSRVLCWWAQ